MRNLFIIAIVVYSPATAIAAEPATLKLLFLGDHGHHKPPARFTQFQPVLKERGIELTYTDKLDDLNAETLAKYDGLVIYANTTIITPEQETALLDYVAGGKGFVPLHCASCLLPQLAQVRRPGRGPVPKARHRHVPHDPRRATGTPDPPRLRAASKAGTKPTSTPSTTRRTARCWNIATKRAGRSPGPGSARTARAASSTPPGATTSGPGAIPAFRTWSSAASAGRSATIRPSCRRSPMHPNDARDDRKADGREAVRVQSTPRCRSIRRRRPQGATANRGTRCRSRSTPAESMKHIVTPADFEVELFAAEPDLAASRSA